jgi:DNA-binding winged helix-turn-helix (wHTH) protein
MKTVYYFGKDTSIFDSLESLSQIKKSFLIKKIDNVTKKKFNDSVLILDDSFIGFIKLIKIYSKDNYNNLIVTTKKENITLSSLQNFKIFLKPIKILDLYKEILKKIKNNFNDFNFRLNHSDFSLTDEKGINLKLTEKEFKFVEVLLNNNEKAMSRKNLLYNVWGLHLDKVESLNTRVLETLLSRVRKKIISSKIKIKIIKNKSGYILIK